MRECLVCWNSAERARPVRQVSQIVSRSEKNTQARDPIGCRASTKSRIRSRDGKRTVNRRFTRVSQPRDTCPHTHARKPHTKVMHAIRIARISVGEIGPPTSVNGFGLTGRLTAAPMKTIGPAKSGSAATAPGAKPRRRRERSGGFFDAAVAAEADDATRTRGEIKTRALHTVAQNTARVAETPRALFRNLRIGTRTRATDRRSRSLSSFNSSLTWWRGCRSPAPRCTRRLRRRTSCPRRT